MAKGEKSETEARKFATEFVMKEVDRRKEFLVEGKDYDPLFKPPGSVDDSFNSQDNLIKSME